MPHAPTPPPNVLRAHAHIDDIIDEFTLFGDPADMGEDNDDPWLTTSIAALQEQMAEAKGQASSD